MEIVGGVAQRKKLLRDERTLKRNVWGQIALYSMQPHNLIFLTSTIPKPKPKRVEKTVRKGEIAHYKQFLLFPVCVQMTCSADTFGKRLTPPPTL